MQGRRWKVQPVESIHNGYLVRYLLSNNTKWSLFY